MNTPKRWVFLLAVAFGVLSPLNEARANKIVGKLYYNDGSTLIDTTKDTVKVEATDSTGKAVPVVMGAGNTSYSISVDATLPSPKVISIFFTLNAAVNDRIVDTGILGTSTRVQTLDIAFSTAPANPAPSATSATISGCLYYSDGKKIVAPDTAEITVKNSAEKVIKSVKAVGAQYSFSILTELNDLPDKSVILEYSLNGKPFEIRATGVNGKDKAPQVIDVAFESKSSTGSATPADDKSNDTPYVSIELPSEVILATRHFLSPLRRNSHVRGR